jgi:hypothetical protein
MDELKFFVQSEDAVNLGYVTFSKDELLAFIRIEYGMWLFSRLNGIN